MKNLDGSTREHDQPISTRFSIRKILLDEKTLAYAISVHKSQGSEYPVMVLPVLTQRYMMLHQNLLYTAISRPQKIVVCLGFVRRWCSRMLGSQLDGQP